MRVQEQQARIDELGGNAHHWWLQACALETDRNAIRQSWSWRITMPVRWIGGLAIHGASALRRGANEVVRVSIDTFQRPLARLMRIVLNKPVLSDRINQILLRFPPLHQQLLAIAQHTGLMPSPTQNAWDNASRRSEKNRVPDNSIDHRTGYYLRYRIAEEHELTSQEILMRIRSEVDEMRNG